MDKKTLLYEQILKVIKHGYDAEVRLSKDGELVVYEVRRQKTKLNTPLLNGQ
ncbi:MAG: hypothetical protein IKK33_16375 [Lachnospiraceae bacterium]|nr:hypothetical protein [Lachnospiraceae bacterium]